MKRESKQPNGGVGMEPAAFAALSGGMVGAMAEAGQAYLKGMVALNQEVMSFANQRLKTNVETGESLVKCESWTDAARLQQDWTRQATEAYVAESTKLMELATRTTMESWASLLDRANGALRERSKV